MHRKSVLFSTSSTEEDEYQDRGKLPEHVALGSMRQCTDDTMQVPPILSSDCDSHYRDTFDSSDINGRDTNVLLLPNPHANTKRFNSVDRADPEGFYFHSDGSTSDSGGSYASPRHNHVKTTVRKSLSSGNILTRSRSRSRDADESKKIDARASQLEKGRRSTLGRGDHRLAGDHTTAGRPPPRARQSSVGNSLADVLRELDEDEKIHVGDLQEMGPCESNGGSGETNLDSPHNYLGEEQNDSHSSSSGSSQDSEEEGFMEDDTLAKVKTFILKKI